MTLTSLFGTLAALASMIALAPQARKIHKLGHARDISGATFAILCASYVFWMVYGLLLTNWPIIVTNIVCLVLAGFILAVKIRTAREEGEAEGTPRADSR